MTVESLTRSQSFVGGQGTLNFNFRTIYNQPSYINVNVVSLTGGTITPLVYNVGYTVVINSDGIGGTVTVSPTYSSACNYVVYRVTPLTQTSEYSDYNPFPAATVENNFDQLTLIDQENSDDYTRSVQIPIGTTPTISTTLPIPVPNTVLGWDGTGTILTNYDPATNNFVVISTASTLGVSDGLIPSQHAVKQYVDNRTVTLSVKDYGAMGNGITDDSTAINNAIAACPNYGIVFFPTGVYLLSSSSISLNCTTGQRIILKGEGRKNSYLYHVGTQTSGCLVIQGGGFEGGGSNTGSDVQEMALGSLYGPALIFNAAARCFDTRNLWIYSASPSYGAILFTGDTGMIHLNDITDDGNDNFPTGISSLIPNTNQPLYGIDFEVGGGTQGPQEIRVIQTRFEYTSAEAVHINAFEEIELNDCKFGSGRNSGPAINILKGTVFLTGHTYIEQYGTGTVGIQIDNRNATVGFSGRDIDMGAQTFDIGVNGSPGTNLVSVDISLSIIKNIQNFVKAYCVYFNLIDNVVSISPTTWTGVSGNVNISGNRYNYGGSGTTYRIIDSFGSAPFYQRVSGTKTVVTTVGSENGAAAELETLGFTPGTSSTVTLSLNGNLGIILLANAMTGAAAWALVSYNSSTVTLLSGSDPQFLAATTPSSATLAISKNTSSGTITLKTGATYTYPITIQVLGSAVASVTP